MHVIKDGSEREDYQSWLYQANRMPYDPSILQFGDQSGDIYDILSGLRDQYPLSDKYTRQLVKIWEDLILALNYNSNTLINMDE